jgi:hypothetical protein
MMATIRQLIQTSPAKANDLFARLVDTSEAAVKTRERLLQQLKEELALLAEVEEKHLYPMLKRHKETKDLVAEALNDNRQSRKLLADLENTPRDSSEFATKAAELRKVFQQHVRDEKKELLPAVLKVLTDEEAQNVVERIEDHIAEREEEKRAEAEERRAAAAREREQSEQVSRAAGAVAQTAWAVPRQMEQAVASSQQLVEGGMEAVAGVAQRSTDQWTTALQAFDQQSRAMQGFFEANLVFARTAQTISEQWTSAVYGRLQRNLECMNALMTCRTLPELVALQSEFLKGSMEQTADDLRQFSARAGSTLGRATQMVAQGARPIDRRSA